MPELPEVETVRRGLESRILGRRIAAVEVGRERAVRRTGRESVVTGLTGATIIAVRRRGKWLLAELDSGDEFMVHLRMSGRLLLSAPDIPRPPHCHVVATLDDDGHGALELRFVDPRTFGEVAVYDARERDEVVPEIARLGPDPLLDGIDPDVLRASLARTSRPIKSVILDQGVIAGVGNIYGDEILHRCGISPMRPARDVGADEAGRIALTTVQLLSAAADADGSTLADTQYVGVDGSHGRFQDEHRVYACTGRLCTTCGKTPVRRDVVGGRSTHWCPLCQT